jgi:putative endonuclease
MDRIFCRQRQKKNLFLPITHIIIHHQILMYFVYIIQCSDNTLYTGITTNLDRRVEEHNNSKLGAKYTKVRRPVKLVFSKEFENRSEASKEESRIKKLSRLQKIDLFKK